MRLRNLVYATLSVFVITTTAAAQTQCPAIVQQALSQVTANCTGIGRNSACYGYSNVQADLVPETDPTIFDAPTDKAALRHFNGLRTLPLNEANQTWGLALMNVQANVPNVLPGQGVLYLLMGDAQIKNMVTTPPDLSQVIEVTVATAANIRAEPNLSAPILGSEPRGTVLNADARRPNGNWVRVIYEGTPGWMSRQTLIQNEAIDMLPGVRPTQMSYMQAFQLTTGIGEPGCIEAAGTLIVQGPNNITVDIAANGAQIAVSSTVALNLTTQNTLQVATLHNAALVDGVQVPAGYITEAPLNADGMVAQRFSTPKVMTAAQLARFAKLQLIPPGILHYPIVPPTEAELQQREQALRQQPPPPPASNAPAPPPGNNDDRAERRNRRNPPPPPPPAQNDDDDDDGGDDDD